MDLPATNWKIQDITAFASTFMGYVSSHQDLFPNSGHKKGVHFSTNTIIHDPRNKGGTDWQDAHKVCAYHPNSSNHSSVECKVLRKLISDSRRAQAPRGGGNGALPGDAGVGKWQRVGSANGGRPGTPYAPNNDSGCLRCDNPGHRVRNCPVNNAHAQQLFVKMHGQPGPLGLDNSTYHNHCARCNFRHARSRCLMSTADYARAAGTKNVNTITPFDAVDALLQSQASASSASVNTLSFINAVRPVDAMDIDSAPVAALALPQPLSGFHRLRAAFSPIANNLEQLFGGLSLSSAV